MARLSLDEHDVTELMALLSLVEGDQAAPLPWAFLHRLRALIGCDVLLFGGNDFVHRIRLFAQVPDVDGEGDVLEDTAGLAELFPAPEDDPFLFHYDSCEACSYPEHTLDFRSVTLLSDFYSDRQWHAHPMYVDVFADEGYNEHEIMLSLRYGAEREARLLCFRDSGPDFGERERFLLTLLRPHVVEAFRAARQRRAAAALTPRQVEVLELVREGLTNRQVARRLGVSEATVRTHLAHIFTSLGVTSRTAAVGLALPEGSWD